MIDKIGRLHKVAFVSIGQNGFAHATIAEGNAVRDVVSSHWVRLN